MSSLFITGFSGFIGRRLLRRLDSTKYERVFGLSRHVLPPQYLDSRPNFVLLQGALTDASVYARSLACADTVIHLAAVTGKRPHREYFAVNVEGTRFFLQQCARAGVRNFLYISTIAVKYPDKRGYYYAESKQMAEQVVRESGLKYVIARPTLVIGEGGSVWQSLSRLARAPVTLMFGDGTTRVQPIDIEDLIDCLLTILYEGNFSDETYELGGPETISFESFLRAAHWHSHGSNAHIIHLPYKPSIWLLSIMERLFYSLMPLTAGQLAAFGNDSTITPNRIYLKHRHRMKDVDQMLVQVIVND